MRERERERERERQKGGEKSSYELNADQRLHVIFTGSECEDVTITEGGSVNCTTPSQPQYLPHYPGQLKLHIYILAHAQTNNFIAWLQVFRLIFYSVYTS